MASIPRGQPWTPAMMLLHGCEGLRVRRMTVLWMFRRPFLGHPGPRQFLRNELRDLTTIVPTTAYHRRSYAERYSRYNYNVVFLHPLRGSKATPFIHWMGKQCTSRQCPGGGTSTALKRVIGGTGKESPHRMGRKSPKIPAKKEKASTLSQHTFSSENPL
jgi:hypothetical protein